MKIDFYAVKGRPGRVEPDLDHELPAGDAINRAKAGEPVLIKLWLRTEGQPDLQDLERRLAEALAPLGLR